VQSTVKGIKVAKKKLKASTDNYIEKKLILMN
jgi:hypothetical protein